MCSCWDRWGSRPSFEVPAKEVVASRGLSTPLCKIFRTDSHWATSLSQCFPSNHAGLRHCWVITRQEHLTKNKKIKKNLANVYKFTTVQRQWKTAWGLSRCADKNSGDLIYESEKEWEIEHEGGKKNTTSHSPSPFFFFFLRASCHLTIWILWCPLYCCWQIITNWIPQVRWHTVKADLILLWRYLPVNQFRLRYYATTAENPWSLLLSPGPRETGGGREEKKRHTSRRQRKRSVCACIYIRSTYNSRYQCEIRSFARVYFFFSFFLL